MTLVSNVSDVSNVSVVSIVSDVSVLEKSICKSTRLSLTLSEPACFLSFILASSQVQFIQTCYACSVERVTFSQERQ